MNSTLIAVATNDQGAVSPHAGRARHWQVYVLDPATTEPALAWSIDLTETGCLHEWHVRNDASRHPLHAVDVAIAGSAGDGVIRRLAQRDTALVTTAESNPWDAVIGYIAGTLLQGLPREEQHCLRPQHRMAHDAEH